MSALRHIRKSVLGISQADMATIAVVSQGTVSKWENGESDPNLDEMARIRDAAIKREIPWDDSWFFETPADAVNEETAA
jgi:transcriptional regulator with XRE-family HTH domain